MRSYLENVYRNVLLFDGTFSTEYGDAYGDDNNDDVKDDGAFILHIQNYTKCLADK